MLLAWIIIFKVLPNTDNAYLSHVQLKFSINAIAKKNTNLFATCHIWDESDKLRFKNDNIDIIDNMKKNQRVISIANGDSYKSSIEPNEVYGIFESWLFLENKRLPYEIIAICWSYTSGGVDNTIGQTTIITKPVFEQLYREYDVSQLPYDKAAKKLADLWIEHVGYVKK